MLESKPVSVNSKPLSLNHQMVCCFPSSACYILLELELMQCHFHPLLLTLLSICRSPTKWLHVRKEPWLPDLWQTCGCQTCPCNSLALHPPEPLTYPLQGYIFSAVKWQLWFLPHLLGERVSSYRLSMSSGRNRQDISVC